MSFYLCESGHLWELRSLCSFLFRSQKLKKQTSQSLKGSHVQWRCWESFTCVSAGGLRPSEIPGSDHVATLCKSWLSERMQQENQKRLHTFAVAVGAELELNPTQVPGM